MDNKDPKLKEEILLRLKNIKGHVNGIEKMVAEEKPCADIVNQLAAVRASVEKVGLHIIEHEACNCLGIKDFSDAEKEDLKRVLSIIMKFLK